MKALFIVRSSAGELEWVLPIMDSLRRRAWFVDLAFVTERGRSSSYANGQCARLLAELAVRELLLLNPVLERIYKGLDLLYRISQRLHQAWISRSLIWGFSCLLSVAGVLNKIRPRYELVFFEFSSDKSLFAAWLRRSKKFRTIIYFPHSPHIYANTQNYSQVAFNSSNMKINEYNEIYWFGSRSDLDSLKDARWSPAVGAEIVYFGHPKLSLDWITKLKHLNLCKTPSPTSGFSVAILSRGSGNFIDSEEQKRLCLGVYNTLADDDDVDRVFIKRHPREIQNSHWNKIFHEKFEQTEKSVIELAGSVDLFIGFWTSAALEINRLGIPYIEYYDPSAFPAGQISTDLGCRTVYDIAGLATTAPNEPELMSAVESVKRRQYVSPTPDDEVISLFRTSDNWHAKFEELLNNVLL